MDTQQVTQAAADALHPDRYEGWANRQTWTVMLWINNDEGAQEGATELVRGTAGYEAETALRAYVEETMVGEVLEGASLASDLLGHALAVVDWRECVRSLREDAGIECDTCQLFGVPGEPCYDAVCGCSECEGVRAAEAVPA